MVLRFIGIPLGRHREAPVFPARIARPRLLLAPNVDACRVDFIVASALEEVETALVVVERCNACACGFIRAAGWRGERLWVTGWRGGKISICQWTGRGAYIPECHGAQDDAVLAGSCVDQRHVGVEDLVNKEGRDEDGIVESM